MAISLGSNLALHTRLPLDDRTIMETIEEMKDYPENFLPDIAYCFVKSDGKMYVFNRENESTELTGKWRVLEGSGGGTTDVPIEKIKVNGELQTPVNKVVDITVPDSYDDTDIRTELANKSDTDHTHTTVNGHTVESDVPVDAKFTDTVYDDTQVKTQIQTVANGLMDSVGYSADYKSIDIIAKNSEKKSIDVAPIISHASITELSDVDTTNKATGKALVYNAITSKHEYADVSGTDEKVKMDASGDSKYLGELLDNVTITNENGELKVKKLDGQEVTITEINYLKGLTMNVMDLVNMFSNGGVKIINTPVATYAELLTLDKSAFIEGISYLVYVLADENHDNAKTTYLVDKDSETPTYFGFADSHRDFTTNPIDLATEITGKLGIANMDSDAIKALFTVDDTYKTETATNNAFSTHGAKALYDELLLAIGGKANDSDFTTHRDDTSIHVSTTEKETWNKAQENVIETVNVNGSALTPTDKAVDITVPTTVAELTDSSSYAKKSEIPTTLPANGGNADTVNNHTVKSDVPENAVFTDTIYDDTDIKAEIAKKADAISTPHIDETTKNWFIGDVDTGILAEGKDGADGTTYTPSIGEVTTVDSTELASATVSVNTETKEAVFNFAIPRGKDGNVQIDDSSTNTDSTWSSQKTSDEIAKIGDVYNYQVGSSTQNFVSGINTFSCNTKLHAGLYLFIVTGIHERAGNKDIADINFFVDGKPIRIYYGGDRLPSMCLAYATSVTDNPTVAVQITSNAVYQTYSVWKIQAIRLK